MLSLALEPRRATRRDARPRSLRRLLPVLLVALLTACARPAATLPPNIVMVLIDTLRWDRLGAYGSDRGLTPFMDEFASTATVFRRAYAQSSWTNASVASLFTSRYQSEHGVTSFFSPLPPEEVTLAEVLHHHGYASGAFLANFLLRAQLGFGQGFTTFDSYSRLDPQTPGKFIKATAERINRESLAWLDQNATHDPLFLYLHYMEPHAPFGPLPAALAHVLGGRPAPDVDTVNQAMATWPLVDFAADPALMQGTKDLYDAEVMSVDTALRDVFAELRRRGVLDDAIVVVLADHGEEFLEHGLIGHNNTLFEEVIRVPLMIHLPEQTQRLDVDRAVSLVDLAPTLLDLAGIAAPPSFDGHSFAPLLRRARDGAWSLSGVRAWWAERTRSELPVVSELIKEPSATRHSPHERAIIAGSDKLIAGFDEQREFYDLAADPGEQHPEALDTATRARLERSLAPLQASAAHGGNAVIDEDTKERMRALGYTH